MTYIEDDRMDSFIDELGLTSDQVKDTPYFFQLLDRDSSGELSLTELVQGCLRLSQNAKAFDVANMTMLIQLESDKQEQFRAKVEAFQSRMEAAFARQIE